MTNQSAARAIWRVYFSLAALQTCLVLALLLQTQSAENTGRLLGLSPTRLVFALGLLAILLGFAWLLLETWLRPQPAEKRLRWLLGVLGRRRWWNWLAILCGAGFLIGVFSLLQLPAVQEPFTRLFFDRLAPLILWATGMSAQTFVALLALRHGHEVFSARPKGRLFYLCLLAFGGIMLGWSWVASTTLPVESQRVGWNLQGVPIVEWQVLVAWLAGVLVLAVSAYLNRPAAPQAWLERLALRRIDLLLAFLIWLGAVLVWQSIPLMPSWFIAAPVAPNFEYYPKSDAQAYDAMAQTALVGEGFHYYGSSYMRRPALAFYLTVLRLVGGQSYPRVILLQVLVLALIPVLVFLLTKALHTRMSAVMAATLIIIREANSIWLTERITTSHVKLLMADLPGMLVTLLFIWLGVIWLQNIAERRLLAVACGSALGLAMMVRPETFVFLFPLLLFSGVTLWPGRSGRLWLQSSALVVLGLLLVISPWIWRNYRLTGEIFFDSPLHNASLILQRFQTTAETPPAGQIQAPSLLATPGIPTAQPSSPSAPPTPSPAVPAERLDQVLNQALGLILEDPGAIAKSSVSHYLNSQVQMFLTLPTMFRFPESVVAWLGHRSGERLWDECCGLVTYIRQAPYWRQWDGRFPAYAWFALGLNLLLLAYGVQVAWVKRSWAGLFPLAASVTYLLANALFRNSGGRYILPVDWVALVYFSIGLLQATMAALAYLKGAPVAESSSGEPVQTRLGVARLSPSLQFYALLLTIFLLACMVPAVEASFPQRFDAQKSEQMLGALLRSDRLSAGQRLELQSFLDRGGIVYTGRALYPRYFPANVGDPGLGRKATYGPKPYPRIVFYLAGPVSMPLALPVERKPSSFPNAVDALVIGCHPDDILLVARFSAEGALDEVYLRSFLTERLTCPLPVIPGPDN